MSLREHDSVDNAREEDDEIRVSCGLCRHSQADFYNHKVYSDIGEGSFNYIFIENRPSHIWTVV